MEGRKGKRGKKSKGQIKIAPKVFVFRPMSTSVTLLCTDNVLVTSVSGVPDIAIKAGGVNQSYYNLSRLAALADYTENNEYEFFRIKRVSFVLTRSADETAVFNQLHGCSIFLTYYPVLSSAAMPYSVTSRDASSYKIDLMTFNQQSLVLYPEDIDYQNSVDGATYNNKHTMPYGNATKIDGCLAISTDNTVANIASVPLFQMKVSYLISFHHRL